MGDASVGKHADGDATGPHTPHQVARRHASAGTLRADRIQDLASRNPASIAVEATANEVGVLLARDLSVLEPRLQAAGADCSFGRDRVDLKQTGDVMQAKWGSNATSTLPKSK